jgi:hypothetical protein
MKIKSALKKPINLFLKKIGHKIVRINDKDYVDYYLHKYDNYEGS